MYTGIYRTVKFVEILIKEFKKEIDFCRVYLIQFLKKRFSFSSNGPTNDLINRNHYTLILNKKEGFGC